ncbi:uncharacterized protein G2W53_042396 [Senna tora]|uniref:Uncharacterized protein n=1 Tax=Senna tora TaxID=362788 RepID=A0A834VZV6_9FABA|nr:uncharacterized protein G2W53_042396 [Senna tora]
MTRLSASAKPFTLNRSTQQPTSKISVQSGPEPSIYSPDHSSSDPFGSLLDSFPKFNSGAKGNSLVSAPLADHGSSREAAAAAFPIDSQTKQESLSKLPSVEFQENDDYVVVNGSDFDMSKGFSVPVYCSNITGNGSGLNYGKQGKDFHESLFSKGNDDACSAVDGRILQKGKHAADGLNLFPEASDGNFITGTDSILAKDILSISKGKMQEGAISSSVLTSHCENAPFILSTPDMSSASKLNNTSHNQGCYASSVVTYSNYVSSGAADDRYFSEVPSCVSNITSDSMGNHPAAIHGSSSASSVPFPFDSSWNMDYLTGSCGTNEDKHCSISSMSGTKDTYVVPSADGKGTDDGDKEKIYKSFSSDATNYLTNSPNEVPLKSYGTGGDLSIKTSPKSLGDDDSDLDSPCWKGTMTFTQSCPEVLGSVYSQYLEKEAEKCNSLNPLAPLFIPSNAEGSICLGSKKVKDDFVSSKSSVPLAINLLPEEDRQRKTVVPEVRPTELKKGVDPKCSFVLNSTCMTQPVSTEDCSTMKRTIVTSVDGEGCSVATKDAMGRESTRGSFPTMCHSSTQSSSSSQADVVNDLFKTLQGVSKSLIDSPKLDVQIMVNAMHVLSELLVQTRANGLDSYKEHDNDTVQHIINNLNVFSTCYSGQMIPTLHSTHTGSPNFIGRSSELPKYSKNGVEVGSIETFSISKKLHHQSDNRGQNRVSGVTADRGQYSLSSSSGMATENGNELVQVIRRNLGKIQDVEEKLHPQALLYKNLWLDAEAALCYVRRPVEMMVPGLAFCTYALLTVFWVELLACCNLYMKQLIHES